MEEKTCGSGEHGGGMSWGHDPPLSGSVAVQGSGGPFVHIPPSFHRHADCNGCMLQVANAAYHSL